MTTPTPAPDFAQHLPEAGAVRTPDVQPPPATPGAPRRQMLWLGLGAGTVLLAGLAVLLLLVLPGSRSLTVEFTLIDIGSDCSGGTGGYDDVGPGTDVVIRDNSGDIIGSGTLGGGEELPDPLDDGLDSRVGCTWTSTVDVPSGEDFYAVTVGDRGELVYGREDLDRKDWRVELSLGRLI